MPPQNTPSLTSNPLFTEFGARLVLLQTGAPGLRGQMTTVTRVDDQDKDVLHMRASDNTLDRYDEIVQASGWKLANYEKNPVIQNSHQYGDILFTVGRAEKTWVEGDSLLQTWRFASAANPVAKIARDLYAGGFLKASSVGFIPLKWENGNEKAGFRRRYTEQELLEVSAVGIPANPNALTLAAKAGAVAKSDLRELHGLLKNFIGEEETRPHSGAQGAGLDGAQLMPIARELRDILRRS